MFLYQNRSLIIQVSLIIEENPSIDYLIGGFQEKLEEYKTRIEGIRYYNYKDNKFLVTFKVDENILLGETRQIVHFFCMDGYTTPDGITLKSEIPEQPADLINLYPVPFEMEERHIKSLEERGFGKIQKITFGKLRHYPNIKNGYVNIYVKDPNYHLIKNQINLMGHWISITTPYNRHLPMCRFCKIRGHEVEQCPKLEKRKEKEMKNKEKEREKKEINFIQKDGEIPNITFGDFILPKRKRNKSNNNDSSKITTSTPKKKKQRNQKSKDFTSLNLSSESDTDDERKKRIEKPAHISFTNRKNKTKKEERETSDSSDEIFETIKSNSSIIKTLSDNESKEKTQIRNTSFRSYKDVVLKKL